jgi:histidinol-phosphate phosphatase family protein
MIDQAVILCGGRGTRLEATLGDLPKALVPVAGAPLLGHLLGSLHRHGVRHALLLAGHRGDQVAAAAARLAPPGLVVETLVERAARGTAGALRAAGDRLAERSFLVLGDVLAAVDWRRLAAAAEAVGGLGTLLVHRSTHPEDSDAVLLDDHDRVIGWARPGEAAARRGLLTNAGVAVLHRDLLRYLPEDRSVDLNREVLPGLVAARAPLHGYRSCEYVKDLGTPERLARGEADVRSGRAARRAELVLLDRDGVLSEERGHVTRPEDLVLLPGAARAVRALNDAGLRVAVVTNQAGIARGLSTAEDVERIHARLHALLAGQGAHLDGLHVCPHHPEVRPGEGRAELRGPCRCRKPATGLVEDALVAWGGEPGRAVVVGDHTRDLLLAVNAGLPGLVVDSGYGGRDGAHDVAATWRFPDLAAAAGWLAEPALPPCE